jgi:hypothetical protein
MPPPREPEPEPEPPPPAQYHATATLTGLKGVKLAPADVAFTQTEGEGTRIVVELSGLKAGRYHLAVHEGASCGKNAAGAGPIWVDAADATLDVEVEKGAPASLDQLDVPMGLTGDAAVVGHTLVLHADKKGKPGKAVACGEIVSSDAEPE